MSTLKKASFGYGIFVLEIGSQKRTICANYFSLTQPQPIGTQSMFLPESVVYSKYIFLYRLMHSQEEVWPGGPDCVYPDKIYLVWCTHIYKYTHMYI